jgi:hypothetical protein
MSAQDPRFGTFLRTMQIIAGAMVAGVTIFLALVLFLVEQRGGQPQAGPDAPPAVTLVSVVLLLSAGAAALFIPGAILKAAAARLAKAPRDGAVLAARPGMPGGPVSDTAYLLTNKQTAMIVGMALFEGAAFCACIAYLVEVRPLALGVAAVALVGLLSFFPTEGWVSAWLAEQRRVVEGLRARGG